MILIYLLIDKKSTVFLKQNYHSVLQKPSMDLQIEKLKAEDRLTHLPATIKFY